MKKTYKIAMFFLLSFIMTTYSLSAADKLYVFFDDIDNVYTTQYQQIITDGVDQIYYDKLTLNNVYTPNLLKTGYGNFFSSGKNLTDFEVAVFFVGNRPLQYDAGSGHKIVREIRNMLDAGKRVILIGNAMLYAAFGNGSQYTDPEVSKFFLDYAGITPESYIAMMTNDGSTFTGFGVKALQGDPVSKGYKKVCNAIHGPDTGGDLYPPWRFTEWIDLIDLSKTDTTAFGERAIQTEFFTWTYDWFEMNTAPRTDSAVGIRVTGPSNDPVQDYKLVIWTTGFEVACATQSMPDWKTEIWYAMNWCVSDLPAPGPNITFDVDPLDFETVAVDDSSIKAVTVKNTGRETLEVYDIYTEGFAPDGVFTVLTEELSFDLAPGESKIIEIRFEPRAEEYYSEYLDAESNAANGSLIGIELTGWGGKKPDPGPKLAVISDVLDFGTIEPSQKDTLHIKMINPGIAPLFIMRKFHWPRETQPPFMYDRPYEWSMTIEPGDTLIRSIKFAPAGMQGTFYDTIGIVPDNAVNYKDDTLWVYLKGISGQGSGDAGISVTTNALSFDSTEIGEKAYLDFEIANTGTQIVYISKLEMEDDFDGALKVLDDDEEDFQHKIPIAMYLNGPNKKRLFNVEFRPKEPITYEGKVIIEFIDEFDNPLTTLNKEIAVTAISKDTATGGSVVPSYDKSENLYLSISPNPAYDYANIQYSIDKSAALEIYVVDMLGNKIMTLIDNRMNIGSYNKVISLSNLSSGMYHVVATSNGEIVKVPLVIVK